MALQASGAISLANIQTEFGGSNPIGINEYYGVAAGVPASGTISLNNFYGKSAGLNITLLLMAGGGYASSDEEDPRAPGGGGGGGLLIQSLSITGAGANAVTVGGGSANSSFPSATTAISGGYTYNTGEGPSQATSGGSGGGASGSGPGSTAGAGTPGQGNPGGNISGGGGAGGGGGNGSAGVPGGAGGSGYDIATFRGGSSLTVAFGGHGGSTAPANLEPAANTGGGATKLQDPGGLNLGGSGIVIIRYPGSTALATGGNSTYTRTVGGTAYYFHEFTSSGTFTKS